jgi:hypothetical protein
MDTDFRVTTKHGTVTVSFLSADRAVVKTESGDRLTVNGVDHRVRADFHRRGTCMASTYSRDVPCSGHRSYGRTNEPVEGPEWAFGYLKGNEDGTTPKPAEVSGYSQFPNIDRLDVLDNRPATDAARRTLRELLLKVMNDTAAAHPKATTAGQRAALERRLVSLQGKAATLAAELKATEAESTAVAFELAELAELAEMEVTA